MHLIHSLEGSKKSKQNNNLKSSNEIPLIQAGGLQKGKQNNNSMNNRNKINVKHKQSGDFKKIKKLMDSSNTIKLIYNILESFF